MNWLVFASVITWAFFTISILLLIFSIATAWIAAEEGDTTLTKFFWIASLSNLVICITLFAIIAGMGF